MIQLAYFDYDNEQYHPSAPNNIDKCNYKNFSVVFVSMLIQKTYYPCHKIHIIFYGN